MLKALIKKALLIIMCLGLLKVYAQGAKKSKNEHEELGIISWHRDYYQALAKSKELKKPVLILFQEIPGCSTCKNYGNNVLSHPMMAEIIENLFVPLAIFNNKGGKDKLILQRYGEPSWNNPVVRIVNEYGSDIVPRLAGNYTNTGLYDAMEYALRAEKINIPEYMKLFGDELSSLMSGKIKEKHFQMYCFWSGEKHLGAKEGVLATAPGFIGGREVVKVKYDQNIISEEQLVAHAKNANCSSIAKSKDYTFSRKDDKYYLQHSNYKYLPLTEVQKVKINSALGNNQPAQRYLSPKQLIWFHKQGPTNREILYNQEFAIAWNKIVGK